MTRNVVLNAHIKVTYLDQTQAFFAAKACSQKFHMCV